jgi:hypothetical protein
MPTITFKVSPAEAREIRRRARVEKATVSKFLRTLALGKDEPARRRKLLLKKHPVSGLLVDATPGPAVSQETIDEALANFP